MRDIEVVRIIIQQVSGLRVPLREDKLIQDLRDIRQNLTALEEAMVRRDQEMAAQPDGGEADV